MVRANNQIRVAIIRFDSVDMVNFGGKGKRFSEGLLGNEYMFKNVATIVSSGVLRLKNHHVPIAQLPPSLPSWMARTKQMMIMDKAPWLVFLISFSLFRDRQDLGRTPTSTLTHADRTLIAKVHAYHADALGSLVLKLRLRQLGKVVLMHAPFTAKLATRKVAALDHLAHGFRRVSQCCCHFSRSDKEAFVCYGFQSVRLRLLSAFVFHR